MYNQEEEYYLTKDEILELLNCAISSLEYEDIHMKIIPQIAVLAL